MDELSVFAHLLCEHVCPEHRAAQLQAGWRALQRDKGCGDKLLLCLVMEQIATSCLCRQEKNSLIDTGACRALRMEHAV